MLERLLSAFSLRRAVRKYAGSLGPQLRKDYGAGEFYNPTQIEASARRAKLPMAYIRFGYAGFLTEEDFQRLNSVQTSADYHELRSLLQRFAPLHSASSGFGEVPENPYVSAGTSGGE